MNECMYGRIGRWGYKQEKQEAAWLQQMEEQQVSWWGGTEVPIVSVPL